MKAISIILLSIVIGGWLNVIDACTRMVYQGPNNTIITARSIDWKIESITNLGSVVVGKDRSDVEVE